MRKIRVKDITPPGLHLRKYQLEDLRIILREKKSALLKLPTGTGKSIITAALINTIQFSRVVIICPAIMKLSWKEEIDLWKTKQLQVVVVKTGKQQLVVNDNHPDVVIVSYHLLVKKKQYNKFSAYLRSAPQGTQTLLVLDESQNVRRWQSKRTKAIAHYIAPLATRRLLLSATPILGQITDLHSQLSIIDPQAWGKFKDFCYKYSWPVPDNYAYEGIVFRGTRNVPELRAKLKPYLITRRKKDILKELPPVVQTTLHADIPAAIAKESATHEAQVKAAMLLGEANPGSFSVSRHQLGLSKLPAAKEWVLTFLEENPKQSLVVFGYHQDVVNAITECVKEHKITAAAITGATPIAQRDLYRHNFQNSSLRVLCCNIVAGGVGVTLTKASTCFFAELSIIPKEILQAYGRLHRIGQLDTVNVFYLVGAGSVEESIIRIIRRKLTDEKKVLG